MSGNRAVIVGDAHLYHTPDSRTDRLFHDFIKQVPTLGNQLVIVGDLFEFWFEYRSVIPSQLFPTLTLLAELRDRGVAITMTGGNHDRWGGDFWRHQLGAQFEPEGCEIQIAGWHARVLHGDGIGENHRAARFFHWLTRKKATAATFRLVHPDIGIWAVKKMSRVLGSSTRSEQVAIRASHRQELIARGYFKERPDIHLLVMGHTHRAALKEITPQQWYLNPGPWMGEARYATVSGDGPSLHVFNG